MNNKIKTALTYHVDLGSEDNPEVKRTETLQQKVIYDALGNVKEHIQYLPDGSIEDRVTNIYSADGKLEEEI